VYQNSFKQWCLGLYKEIKRHKWHQKWKRNKD